MSNNTNSQWQVEPSENFLDDHLIYRGIHRDLWIQWGSLDTIQPNFYITKTAINGLSVDWSKYAKPEDTLDHKGNDLTKYGVIQIRVRDFYDSINRNLFPLELIHEPTPKNRAHSLIEGIRKCNKARIKIELSEIAEWVPNLKPHIN